ncbi:tryptophan synthase subunit alpha [Providencia heimbachae]|uniref:tryptophan synthase subunit alpha n=1 Tax=Providencia heimbachae TaxID=333962 RepID=UPI00223F3AAF|nr:tryptophan synthase subunit alpha [Providencia heimbachae]
MKIIYRSKGNQDVIELAYTIFELDKIKYAMQSVRRIADVNVKISGFIFRRMIITGTPEQIKIARKALIRRYR